MISQTRTIDIADFSSRERILSAMIALGVGLLILFTTGFVPIEAIHNAAHDGRHVFSFPCH